MFTADNSFITISRADAEKYLSEDQLIDLELMLCRIKAGIDIRNKKRAPVYIDSRISN